MRGAIRSRTGIPRESCFRCFLSAVRLRGALFSAGRIHATAADLDMEGPEYWRAIGVGALAGALFGLGLAGAGAVVGGLLGVGATTGTAYVSTMYGVNAFCRGAANRYQAENDIDAALANMEMAGGGLMTIGGAYTALRGGVPMWRGGRGYPTFNAMKADLGRLGRVRRGTILSNKVRRISLSSGRKRYTIPITSSVYRMVRALSTARSPATTDEAAIRGWLDYSPVVKYEVLC